MSLPIFALVMRGISNPTKIRVPGDVAFIACIVLNNDVASCWILYGTNSIVKVEKSKSIQGQNDKYNSN